MTYSTNSFEMDPHYVVKPYYRIRNFFHKRRVMDLIISVKINIFK